MRPQWYSTFSHAKYKIIETIINRPQNTGQINLVLPRDGWKNVLGEHKQLYLKKNTFNTCVA